MDKNYIADAINETITCHQRILHDEEMIKQIMEASDLMVQCLRGGNKILICGNGGSAADAQHMAAELVGRFELERAGFAAIALSTDTSVITAIGNDYTFDDIFSRQVDGIGKRGDLLVGISTSGNSGNVIKAMDQAKSREMLTVGLVGNNGGSVKKNADVCLVVKHENTARIQEVHATLIHIICGLVESAMG